VFAIHFAYNVVSLSNTVVLLTFPLVNVLSTYHPSNVYPDLLDVGKLIVPPLQLAFIVWLFVVVTWVSAVIFIFPTVEYHPSKFHVAGWSPHEVPPFESNDIVYALVGLGNVPYVLPYVTFLLVSVFPPVASL